MVEANESGMSQWLGGKEEGKDCLIGMEAKEGARGEVPGPVICDAFSL